MRKSPITIEVLETLDAIDRRGTFAKAAEELNKATSAISYIVQKLEEQLDVTLFQRQGRRSVLTPAGQLLLLEGREILKTTARLAEKTKEVANGWEPRISIAAEFLVSYPVFFKVINQFLKDHPTIEIDLSESVLNGGWEALELGQVDLVVGAPAPAPVQKGLRTITIKSPVLIPVIGSSHNLAKKLELKNSENFTGGLRTVVTHDTSRVNITRSAGISSDGGHFYVQNIDQKVEAILAGIGIGHLPKHRIKQQLKSGELIQLKNLPTTSPQSLMAWNTSNKGQGLKILTAMLEKALC